MEFLKNIFALSLKQYLVYSRQLPAEEWLFFCVFNKKSKLFVDEDNLGFHERDLLKYHESFPVLVF